MSDKPQEAVVRPANQEQSLDKKSEILRLPKVITDLYRELVLTVPTETGRDQTPQLGHKQISNQLHDLDQLCMVFPMIAERFKQEGRLASSLAREETTYSAETINTLTIFFEDMGMCLEHIQCDVTAMLHHEASGFTTNESMVLFNKIQFALEKMAMMLWGFNLKTGEVVIQSQRAFDLQMYLRRAVGVEAYDMTVHTDFSDAMAGILKVGIGNETVARLLNTVQYAADGGEVRAASVCTEDTMILFFDVTGHALASDNAQLTHLSKILHRQVFGATIKFTSKPDLGDQKALTRIEIRLPYVHEVDTASDVTAINLKECYVEYILEALYSPQGEEKFMYSDAKIQFENRVKADRWPGITFDKDGTVTMTEIALSKIYDEITVKDVTLEHTVKFFRALAKQLDKSSTGLQGILYLITEHPSFMTANTFKELLFQTTKTVLLLKSLKPLFDRGRRDVHNKPDSTTKEARNMEDLYTIIQDLRDDLLSVQKLLFIINVDHPDLFNLFQSQTLGVIDLVQQTLVQEGLVDAITPPPRQTVFSPLSQ